MRAWLGYSVRIIPSLWMRSMVMEVYEMLPQGEEGEQPGPPGGGHCPGGGDRAWGKMGKPGRPGLTNPVFLAYNAIKDREGK